MDQIKRVVSIDWLAIYGNVYVLVEGPAYMYKKRNIGTAIFKTVIDVYDKITTGKIATIEMEPYSTIIPSETAIVRAENRLLYEPDAYTKLINIMLASNIEPVNISRIDICCDFDRFIDIEYPEDLIKGFVNGKYIKRGKGKFCVMGENDNGKVNFEYIRFGKRENEICLYLYNKEKELSDVKNKPYIRDLWRSAGLVGPVWRLEASLSNDKMQLISKQTGEIMKITGDTFYSQGVIEAVYDSVIDHCLDVRINDGQKRTERMKKVRLLSESEPLYVVRQECKDACSNRSDKVLINKLYSVAREADIMGIDIGCDIDAITGRIAEFKKMEDYAKISRSRLRNRLE